MFNPAVWLVKFLHSLILLFLHSRIWQCDGLTNLSLYLFDCLKKWVMGSLHNLPWWLHHQILLFKDSNQWKIIKQYDYKRHVRPQPNIKETCSFKTAQHKMSHSHHSGRMACGPAVSQNGTLKRQTDYLFMCWCGGCFCPSCHTSISNVRGPHLGCVKMHNVET